MLRTIKLDLELTTNTLTVDSFGNLSLGDSYSLELRCRRYSAAELLAVGGTIAAVAKVSPEGEAMVQVFDWTAADHLSKPYTAVMHLTASELRALFAGEGGDSPELPEIKLTFELVYINSTGRENSSNKIQITILNDYVRASDLSGPLFPDPGNPFALQDARYLRRAAQDLSTEEMWQVLNNLGFFYDAALGAIRIELPNGAPAALRVTDVF